MKLRGLMSIILSLAIVVTLVPQPVQVSAAERVYNIDISDIDASAPNITMTDAELFALMDLTGMPGVKSAVDAGNYTLAKRELLSYYQTKFETNMPDFYSGMSGWMNYMAMNDAYAFTEERIGGTTIVGSGINGPFNNYYIDLGMKHANGVFVLSSLAKSEAAIDIVAREHSSGSTLGAELIFYKGGSAVKTLKVAKDTFIRYGADYADVNNGKSTYLYVKHDYTSTLPYSGNSRITYLYFNPAEIPATSTYDNIKLKIHARSQIDDIKLEVFDAYNKSWAEYEGDGSGYAPMTWNNYKIAHYSWKGMPGGFDWAKPANVASEWINYNTRFLDQVTLLRTAENYKYSATTTDEHGYTYDQYAHKALSIMLDFANDSYGRIAANTGVPEKRDIESANRCIEFPALYARYIKLMDSSSDHDAQLNINMLKWLYQEITYLYNGAGKMYKGATTTVNNEEIAYNNRGVWHVYGFLRSALNFNEFANFENWKTLAEARLEQNMSKLILSDGAYGEAVFSYPNMVVNYWINLAQIYIEKGITLPEGYLNRVAKVMKYLMDCTQSNGISPNWGHGAIQPRNQIKRWLATGLFTTANGVDSTVLDALNKYSQSYTPSYTDALYPDMRVATTRTGWASGDSMLFMNAKNGRSHSHKDSLAFTWYHNGGELLTDTGMTSYDGGHPHFIFQQTTTRSHNTVEVDGLGQRNQNRPYNDGDSSINMISNTDSTFITAYTDANRHSKGDTCGHTTDPGVNVDHSRNVTYLKSADMIIVHDRLKALDSNTHTYTQNWHTQTTNQRAVTADNTAKQARTSYSTGRNLIIAQPASDNSTVSVSADGLDERFSQSTHYTTFTKTGSGTVNYSTVLQAVDGSDDVSVTVTDRGCDTNNSKLDITVAKNGASEKYTHFSTFDNNTTRSFCGYTTTGSSVTLSLDESGNMKYASVFGGDKLGKSGTTYFDIDGATYVTVEKEGTNLSVLTDASVIEKFVLSGFGTDITSVTVNGESYNTTVSGSEVTVYPANVSWDYYPENKLLHVHGSGVVTDVDFSAYTDATILWIGKDVTVPSGAKLSMLSKVDKVYLDAKYFDIAWTSSTSDATYKSKGYIDGNSALPDTWAIRNQTINSAYALVPSTSAVYIPASATDTAAYNPTENTSTWTYACASTSETYDWEVDVLSGKLTIKGGRLAAGSVRDGRFWPWHNAADVITSIYIDDSVPAIGKNAFAALDNVSDIRFSKTMTGLHMYTFNGNKALKKLIIPGHIKSIPQRGIINCTALTDVILCNGVETIADSAFSGCNNIKKVVIPTDTKEATTSKIPTTAVRYSYDNDTLPASGTVNGQESLTWSYDKDTDMLKFKGTGTIPTFAGNEFSDNMWQAHVNRSTIMIDGDITVEKDAFRAGFDITKVYWNDNYMDFTYDFIATTDNWENYPTTFTLEDGTVIPSANAKIVGCTMKDGWFENDGIEAVPIAGSYATYDAVEKDYASAVNKRYLSNIDWRYDTDTRILTFTAKDAADGTSVHIGNTVNNSELHYPWAYSGYHSKVLGIEFKAQDGLKFVALGKRSLFGMSSMKKLVVPDTVEYIRTRAVQACSSLESVELPEGLKDIGPNAFTSCKKLSEITIPHGTTVANSAFAECNLKKIVCYASSPAASVNFVKSGTTYFDKEIVCYFDGTKVYYQTASDIVGASVYVAGYDSNDNLQAVERLNAGNLTAGTVYSFTPAKLAKLSGCDYMSIMLWYGDNITPVCRVATY